MSITLHTTDRNYARTSTPDPTLGAKGNMANPGTKKTGNHLVKSAVPGPNAVYSDLPLPGTITSMRSKVKNKTTRMLMCM